MPKKKPVTIILCVDRDNDLGRKAGVEGPIIGREKNLEAATSFCLQTQRRAMQTASLQL